MKKLSALLFMFLLIVSFNACDDDSGSSTGSKKTGLIFEIPSNFTSITSVPKRVYSLHKEGSNWHMDTVDADLSTVDASSCDADITNVEPFNAFPFNTSLGSGNYVEIIKSSVIDAYDSANELSFDDTCDLFGFRLMCTDGFTSHSGGTADLSWEQFQTGYLYLGTTATDNPRTWYPQYGDPDVMEELPSGTDGGSWNGKYMAKKLGYVQLFRKVDIVCGAITKVVTLDDFADPDVIYGNADNSAQIKSRAVLLTSIINSTILTEDDGFPSAAILALSTFQVTTALGQIHDSFTDNTIPYSQLSKTYITTAKYQDVLSDNLVDELASTGEMIFIKSSDLSQQYTSFKHVLQIEILVP